MNKRNIRTIRRKKEEKRSRLILILLILAVSAGSGIYFGIRHYAAVKEVVFIGNHHLKNEELISLIKVNQGDRLFGVSSNKIHDRLRKSPWIKDVVVRKELYLPSGRILVRLTEAIPSAILNISGIPYLIDREGNILEQMREGTTLFLPVIRGIDPERSKDAYEEAVRFVNVLASKGIVPSDGEVVITGERPEEITLEINGLSIKMGAGDHEKKLERLEVVKDEIERRNIAVEYIDLRFAERIIIKPVSRADEKHVGLKSKNITKKQRR